MAVLQIKTPRVFEPLLYPARYKCAHGGRSSGKSHFFAELLLEQMMLRPIRAVCIREVQKSIKESVKRLLEDKIEALGIASYFEIVDNEIRHRNGGYIIFQGMQNHTSDSIKSLESFDIAWVEEAQNISQRSIELLIPTIRKEYSDGTTSEIWFSWNPEMDDAPVDVFFRGKHPPKDMIIVEANYLDNPFCPKIMIDTADAMRQQDYDKYCNIWLGQYRKSIDGSIYAKELYQAYSEKRVTRVMPIPGMPVETFWDLGKRDHTAIWFGQARLGEFRFLRCYQNRGQRIEHYIKYIQTCGYTVGRIYLPHDADQERLNADSIAVTMRKAFANIPVTVIPRMPTKIHGIEAARRIFPQCWFDEHGCKDGLKALGKFRYDVNQDTGGYSANPLHDENSDAADAFAQAALSLGRPEDPKIVFNVPSGARLF